MIFPSVIVAGGRVAAEFQALTPDNTNSLLTYTFSSVPFGTESGKRYIVVYAVMRFLGSPFFFAASSVTIGGVSATQLSTYYWGALVPTGTSGTVVATTDAFNCQGAIISVWSVTRLRSLAASATQNGTNSVSIAVPAGGAVLGCAIAGGTEINWTGLTEHSQFVYETGGRFSTASEGFTSATTASVSAIDPGGGSVTLWTISIR